MKFESDEQRKAVMAKLSPTRKSKILRLRATPSQQDQENPHPEPAGLACPGCSASEGRRGLRQQEAQSGGHIQAGVPLGRDRHQGGTRRTRDWLEGPPTGPYLGPACEGAVLRGIRQTARDSRQDGADSGPDNARADRPRQGSRSILAAIHGCRPRPHRRGSQGHDPAFGQRTAPYPATSWS